jgi:hypothetical protein
MPLATTPGASASVLEKFRAYGNALHHLGAEGRAGGGGRQIDYRRLSDHFDVLRDTCRHHDVDAQSRAQAYVDILALNRIEALQQRLDRVDSGRELPEHETAIRTRRTGLGTRSGRQRDGYTGKRDAARVW